VITSEVCDASESISGFTFPSSRQSCNVGSFINELSGTFVLLVSVSDKLTDNDDDDSDTSPTEPTFR